MNKERLGNFIGDERKALGLTQKDLAVRLHVTDKAVSKWERGLSYPDVTLLEPLAAALGMGVEELMACRRQAAAKKEDETMKTLLDISSASVKAERQRGWGRLVAVLALLLAAALGIFYTVTFCSAQNDGVIQLKETVDGTDYIYIKDKTDPGHLLQLKCGEGVDFNAIRPTNELGDEGIYKMSYRWNRWTREGTLTACEFDGFSLGGMMDVTFETECEPLFGYPQVFYTTENYYPDPYSEPRGRGYLCDARFWIEKNGQSPDTGMLNEVQDGGSPYPEKIKKTVLLVEDCMNAVIADMDGDGENEVVVRTRWPEKPYTIYDLVNGEITETWPDTVPEDVQEKLVCIWEQ